MISLAAEARKNEDAAFERNNLSCQLRDSEHLLEQKMAEVTRLQQRYSAATTAAAELRVQLATLHDKLTRVRSVQFL